MTNMMKKNKALNWTIIPGPPGGSISTTFILETDPVTIFLGSQVGIFRAFWEPDSEGQNWTRLDRAPLGVLCISGTMDSGGASTILAGTVDGIYYSSDMGDHWKKAKLPLSASSILTVAYSPLDAGKSIALAGTLEDGIFYSNTDGRKWQSQSFGMLDASVFSLAFSPEFPRDGTVFAGTESSIYYSYNHAMAWKPLPFPEELAPVLSLAVSPNFMNDHTIFAGTENSGLHASRDNGKTWQPVEIPALCINSLAVTETGTIVAGTELGILASSDLALTWVDNPTPKNALNLAAGANLLSAGFLEHGAWISEGLDWKPLSGLMVRSFSRLNLSPEFEKDGTAFLASSQDGIWRTSDRGSSWQDLSPGFPGEMINQVCLFPGFADNASLVVASDNGLWLSRDQGDSWVQLSGSPCSRVSISTNGGELLAILPGLGAEMLDLTAGDGEMDSIPRRIIKGPWDKGGVILALAQQRDGTIHAAHLEGIGETVSIWQGQPGDLELVHSQPAGANPVVSFWIPEAAPDRPWYASLGEQVWRFSTRRGGVGAALPLFEDDHKEPVIALEGFQIDGKVHLVASTGQQVLHLTEGSAWKLVHQYGNKRAVDFRLSAEFLQDKTAYALLLGGNIVSGNLAI